MRSKSRLPARPGWPEHQRRWLARERAWALWMHRATTRPWVVLLLVAVSWLGDGVLWYTAMALLPWLGGEPGIDCAIYMLAIGSLNLVIYKVVKRHTARPRPFVSCPGIRACTKSLDEFSFPSGHTMHAVAFSIVISSFYPPAAPVAWSFTLLVALSRVVLGLHYPSDVAVGAAIGALTSSLTLLLLT
jgi:undecaprenyl-diphosphatase